MGNPHPTKSKPCKIGRNHLHNPSNKVVNARKESAKRCHRLKIIKAKKMSAQVHKYFLGLLPFFPLSKHQLKTPPLYDGAIYDEKGRKIL